MYRYYSWASSRASKIARSIWKRVRSKGDVLTRASLSRSADGLGSTQAALSGEAEENESAAQQPCGRRLRHCGSIERKRQIVRGRGHTPNDFSDAKPVR